MYRKSFRSLDYHGGLANLIPTKNPLSQTFSCDIARGFVTSVTSRRQLTHARVLRGVGIDDADLSRSSTKVLLNSQTMKTISRFQRMLWLRKRSMESQVGIPN